MSLYTQLKYQTKIGIKYYRVNTNYYDNNPLYTI